MKESEGGKAVGGVNNALIIPGHLPNPNPNSKTEEVMQGRLDAALLGAGAGERSL